MARNRMIRPDFWDDEKLSIKTSRSARLTYIGMWNFSDDFGSIKANPTWLKNHIYPYEEITVATFEAWLAELEKLRRIFPYEIEGERYYFMPKFLKHQKINKPSKAHRNPPPPDDITEHSGSSHGAFTEHSSRDQVGIIDEVKLKEVKLKEKRKGISDLGMDVGKSITDVIQHLNQKTQADYKPENYETQTLLLDRFADGYSVEDLIKIIDIKTPQWIDDKKSRGWLRPATLFSSEKIEGYLQESKIAPKPKNTTAQDLDINLFSTAADILATQGEKAFMAYCDLKNISADDIQMIRERHERDTAN